MNVTEILGYFFALFVGITMGILGSGGSILSVPILVYIMGIQPIVATGYSLFIVGWTALVGVISKIKKREFDTRTAVWFGIPSIFSVFVTRYFVVPNLPEVIAVIGNFVITKQIFLMLFFAIIMLLASTKMIQSNSTTQIQSQKKDNPILLIFVGLLIGSIAGLVGAGGGFMIIPALVLLMNMEMKKAIGTSLIIIAAQSLLGFSAELSSSYPINWRILLSFTACSIAGIYIGMTIGKGINTNQLRKGFGYFVLIMGIYIIIKEIFYI